MEYTIDNTMQPYSALTNDIISHHLFELTHTKVAGMISRYFQEITGKVRYEDQYGFT